MERLTVTVCVSASLGAVVLRARKRVHGCICLESSREEYKFWLQLCESNFFFSLNAEKSVGQREGGCSESLNELVMCGWLLSLCACGRVCAYVCQVCSSLFK